MSAGHRVMILSPHCDDVPLSLGGGLLQNVFGPDPLVPVVFSISRYTKAYSGTGPQAEVTRLRKAEEIEASKAAGYSPRFLDHREPFARPGYLSFRDVFDQTRLLTDDAVWPTVAGEISSLLRSHEGIVLVPLACGGHVDHRMVHDSALAFIAKNADYPIGFYEDLPYSAKLAFAEIGARIPARFSEPLHAVLLPGDLASKLRLLRLYESQLTEPDYEDVETHWKRTGGERVWLSASATSMFQAKSA